MYLPTILNEMILWGLLKTFSQAFFLILSMSDSVAVVVVVVVSRPHIPHIYVPLYYYLI